MRIRSRWLNVALAWTAAVILRSLFATCRFVHQAPEERLKFSSRPDPNDSERFIVLVWHDLLLIPTFAATAAQREMSCCLVSQHQDGGYLADAMNTLGYRTVRGSTKRGGAQAIKQLMEDARGLHIVITPDGPQGPRHQLKAGAVYLASQLGRRILVTGHACRRGWRVQGRWTDMLIPCPFTTVHLLTAEPLTIPPDLSREELAEQVQRVERALSEVTAQAAAYGRPRASTPSETVDQAAAEPQRFAA